MWLTITSGTSEWLMLLPWPWKTKRLFIWIITFQAATVQNQIRFVFKPKQRTVRDSWNCKWPAINYFKGRWLILSCHTWELFKYQTKNIIWRDCIILQALEHLEFPSLSHVKLPSHSMRKCCNMFLRRISNKLFPCTMEVHLATNTQNVINSTEENVVVKM